MIKQLKRKKVLILALLFPYIFFMFVSTYRIEYSLTAPGGLSAVEQQVTFDSMYESDGELYTTYVMGIVEPTFLQFMMAYFDDRIDTRSIAFSDQGLTDRQRIEYGFLQRDNAWNAAIISAYSALDIHVDYVIRQMVTRIYPDNADIGDLQVLDEILAVNGETENIVFTLNNIDCDIPITLTVRNEADDIVTIDITKRRVENVCSSWFSVEPYYDILEVGLDYEVHTNFVGGPSGGFMQFLQIYNALTEEDLISGMRVAGTGGIDLNGYALPMGGIKQKVIAADMAGVDVFFVPRLNDNNYNDNYQQALRAIEEFDLSITVVGVNHWTDAVNYLLELKGEDHV